MSKKKFFDTDLGKILKGAATIVAPNLVSILEGKTSKEDVLEAIRSSNEPPEVKLKLEELALSYEQEITKRHVADSQQELWLPKMVRPLTLVVLVSTYICGFFLNYDVSVIHAPLMTVFAFYFGGRTWEKLADKHK